MLFHITQVHSPETCPLGEGGSNSLFDPTVEGVKVIGRYGANAEHTLFYIVETDDWQALHKFLLPGFKRATCKITPVSEIPVQH
jgi:tRNA A37 N6-isopentenylltransferase MiaA